MYVFVFWNKLYKIVCYVIYVCFKDDLEICNVNITKVKNGV